MNRYPAWKYLLVVAAVVLGLIYALPNVFGENPAVQISATRTTKVDTGTLVRVEDVLKRNNLPYTGTMLDATGAKVRFGDTETQLRARDIVQKEMDKEYGESSIKVALNLLTAT